MAVEIKTLSQDHKQKMQDGKHRKARSDREQKIKDRTAGKPCRCGIKSSMNDAELRALYPGCADPTCICPVLDGVMRSVYTYA